MDKATLIAQIGTWVTILLVFFTLLEMRNQRKASLKPDLIFPESSFYVYPNFSEDWPVRLIAELCSTKSNAKADENVWESSAPFKFYNVGFGVAKNIELRWIVDYDKTIQQIKDYCYQNSIPLVLQLGKDEFGEDEVVITGLISQKAHLTLYSPETDRFDYLMPVSITSEGMKSCIPSAVHSLLAIIMYLKGHYSRQHPKLDSELRIDFPSMKLDVHYDDVEDSHYSKSFDVVLFPYFWSIKEEKDIKELTWLWNGT